MMNSGRDKCKFLFDSEGYIQSIQLPFLTLENLIYLIASTVIHTVEMSFLHGFNDKSEFIDDGILHNWRSPVDYPLFDRVIDNYTNWSEGCSLNNTLTACGYFLYDLSYQIVRNGKPVGDLWHMREDCSYIGIPIRGVIDKRGIEIITDALDLLQKYSERIAENSNERCKFNWNKNNEALLKLFRDAEEDE